jgi:hypothetical protein
MQVYVVTQRYPYSDTECVSVYLNMEAVMHKLELAKLVGFDEGEEFNLHCMEVIDEEESLKRLNNVRKYKGETVES